MLCSGVADMADELFEVLRPHIEGHSQVHLAGHSLGGSLATLLAVTAHLKLGSISSNSANGSKGSSGAHGSSGANGSNGSVGSNGSSSNGSRNGGSSNGSSSGRPAAAAQAAAASQQRLQVRVTTFGSPPVLALSKGAEEDGRAILQVGGPFHRVVPFGQAGWWVVELDGRGM